MDARNAAENHPRGFSSGLLSYRYSQPLMIRYNVQIATAHKMGMPITTMNSATPIRWPASPSQKVRICHVKCASYGVPAASSRFR